MEIKENLGEIKGETEELNDICRGPEDCKEIEEE